MLKEFIHAAMAVYISVARLMGIASLLPVWAAREGRLSEYPEGWQYPLKLYIAAGTNWIFIWITS